MADRSYLVCATQRSGSTLLCELLKDTGVAGRPEEYFEALRDTGSPPPPSHFLTDLDAGATGMLDDPNPPEAPAYSSLRGLSSYRQHLERTLRAATTPNGVFGAKLMFNQLPELSALAGALPEYAGLDGWPLLDALFHRPLCVRVFRRDKVRQAVSMWRALQSRRWRAGAGQHGAAGEPAYDYDGIDHLVRRFEAEHQGWDEFLARYGVPALPIVYEDHLEHDRYGAVVTVLAHLGLAPPAGWRPAEPIARQADDRSEEWVAAYHRDRSRRTSGLPPDRPPIGAR